MLGKPVIVLHVNDGPLGDNYALLEATSAEWTTGELARWVTDVIAVALNDPRRIGRPLSYIDIFQAIVLAAEVSPDVLLHPLAFGRIHDWARVGVAEHNVSIKDVAMATLAKELGKGDAGVGL